ncbi:MAG: hypothetical protein ACF8PN_14390 [Phycisphaerales bacterium]
MTRFGSSYDIARMTGHCASSGRAIEPGEEYVAALCEREGDDGFDRFDYSVKAWESGDRPPRLFSYWKTKRRQPNEKKGLEFDDDALLNLFQRLEGDEQPLRVAYRFAVAMLLLRKRYLKLDSIDRREDGAIWLVRMKGDPPETPPLEVRDPQMDEEQMRGVSDQLSEVLRGEW